MTYIELLAFFANYKEDIIKDNQNLPDHSKEVIAMSFIEIAINVSIKPNLPIETTRNFSRITEKIFCIWPLTADSFFGIFRFVQELSAEQLHGIWKLVLANRATRKG